jgi:hypothetical protein
MTFYQLSTKGKDWQAVIQEKGVLFTIDSDKDCD